MPSKNDECPGCGGPKTAISALCKKCWAASIIGEGHPNWKGGPKNVCACGSPKSAEAKQCKDCFDQRRSSERSVDGRLIDAREWQVIWRKTPHGKRQTRYHNLKKYGITPEEYDKKLEGQKGVCAACLQPETASNQYGVCNLSVDHNHDDGSVRGLLCMRCNRSLGFLRDDPVIIEALLEYRRTYE